MAENYYEPIRALPSTIDEIEKLISSEVVYMVAVDVKGNLIPITRDGVEVMDREPPSFENPILTEEIRGIKPVTFGIHKGSCCYWYLWGNTWRCYVYPC